MSSADQSRLTSFGYDMVVATTQKSINVTMLEYLADVDGIEGTSFCYVYQKNSQTKKIESVQITLDELKKRAPAADVFNIDNDADPESDVGLQQLRFAGFHCACWVKPGLPSGIDPDQLPHIVELESESASVTYNMLCSEIKVCVMTYMGMDIGWNVYSQQPGEWWKISCKVDLRMSDVDKTTALSKLPPEVVAEIRDSFGKSQAFSVQQLLFNLDNAGLETVPLLDENIGSDASKIEPIAVGLINGSLLGSYFADMKTRGQPLLHMAVVSNEPEESDWRATDIKMEVAQLHGSDGKPKPNLTREEQDLSTLNYLCMSNNHLLPSAGPLTWNWVTQAESEQWDGVISHNRNAFLDIMKDQMRDQVLNNCIIAFGEVPLVDSIPQYYCGFKIIGTGAIINQKNRSKIARWFNENWQNAEPTCEMTDPGDPKKDFAMEWNWIQNPSSYDSGGAPVILGTLEFQPSYNCKVRFKSNQIIIDQRLKLWMKIMKSQDTREGTIIDWAQTTTYNLKVDGHGKFFVETIPGTKIDNSSPPSTNSFMNFFNSLNMEVDVISKQIKFADFNFTDFPIGVAQKYQFPGGKVFSFREFKFSQYGDLTAAITYVEPTEIPQTFAPPPLNPVNGISPQPMTTPLDDRLPPWSSHPVQPFLRQDRLPNGGGVGRNQAFVSANKRYRMVFQDDSNLVLYDMFSQTALWNSHTQGSNGTMLMMQDDGNLVIYTNSNQTVWSTNTQGHQGDNQFVMQDDGNACVYHGSDCTWASNTHQD